MERLKTIQTRENLNVVYRLGNPGPGGAYHDYDVYPANISHMVDPEPVACIQFQKGPRKDPNARQGILDSDLLEIVRDRMRAFCAGEMTDRHTERALSHVEAALHHLNQRVEDRIARGVLGTMKK